MIVSTRSILASFLTINNYYCCACSHVHLNGLCFHSEFFIVGVSFGNKNVLILKNRFGEVHSIPPLVATCMAVRAHLRNATMVAAAVGKPLWSLSNTVAPVGVCDVCGSGELYLSVAVLVGHRAEEPPPCERPPDQTKLMRFNG